jgi:nucleoporin p58/p45
MSSGSLGSTQNQQPQQSTMFSSLGQNQNNQGTSLNQSQGGLFGNTLTGGLTLGQNNQQQTVPGVTIDMSNIRSTTRFGDLHQDIKKEIENIDAVIQAQIRMKNDCDAIMKAHDSQLAQIPHDVEFCQRKLIGVQNAGAGDVYSINLVKKYIDTDVQHAKLSFKAIDNLKLPPQYHNSGIWSTKTTSSGNQVQSNGEGGAQDMVSFFSSTADELAATLASYQKHIVEIEQHLRGVEGSSAAQLNTLIAKRNGSFAGIEDPMEQLTGALRDFEESLLGVAGNVGAAREGVQGLQLGRLQAPPGVKKGPRSGVY